MNYDYCLCDTVDSFNSPTILYSLFIKFYYAHKNLRHSLIRPFEIYNCYGRCILMMRQCMSHLHSHIRYRHTLEQLKIFI